MKNIDFYFDIISPYSYIAHKKIKDNYKNEKIHFNYKPILLGGLHNMVEITAPAFNKFKMINMKRDCELVAIKNNIEFKWNNNFPINSISIMRGCIFVESDLKEKFIDIFFEAYWKNNIDLSDKVKFEKILNNLNIDIDIYFNEIGKNEIKNKLKNFTTEAFNREVFGAPTFIVNDKLFWGQDRLEYAIDEAEK